MIISISGTPGTGKSVVAKMLAEKLNRNLITVSTLRRKGLLEYGYDKKRKTKIIDENDFEKAARKSLVKSKINVIESHLAHLIKSDFVFILRTNPVVLEKRLKKRKWPKTKIRENLEAEMLDEITIEALNKNKNIYEIDTSDLDPKKTVAIILKILNNYSFGKAYRAGKIDWIEKYGKNFLQGQRIKG
jgi:adenylate kinase